MVEGARNLIWRGVEDKIEDILWEEVDALDDSGLTTGDAAERIVAMLKELFPNTET